MTPSCCAATDSAWPVAMCVTGTVTAVTAQTSGSAALVIQNMQVSLL